MKKKAAKLFARGTRSLQCCKDEQKWIKKIKIPRGGARSTETTVTNKSSQESE